MYAHRHKIGKPNKLKVFVSKYTKRSKQDSQNGLRFPTSVIYSCILGRNIYLSLTIFNFLNFHNIELSLNDMITPLHVIQLDLCVFSFKNLQYILKSYMVRIMVFNDTFNNMSAISWWSVYLVEETVVLEENHQPAASHRQTLSHNVVSSTARQWLQALIAQVNPTCK